LESTKVQDQINNSSYDTEGSEGGEILPSNDTPKYEDQDQQIDLSKATYICVNCKQQLYTYCYKLHKESCKG
jgi:hypothetical protein